MSETKTSSRGLGGFGAVLFLGAFGAIAFYVQQHNAPPRENAARKAATIIAEAREEAHPTTLPWKDRLTLGAAALIPVQGFHSPPPASEKPDRPEHRAPVDPARARLVQDLNDGHRILLTLDPVLQRSAKQIFHNREVPYAAAVILDLRDNAVLTMVGHSTMDPHVDPLEVVTTPWAPAASTFKLVTTASLLETGAVHPTTRVCFNGGLHGIENKQLTDNPRRDSQCETLANAVAHSYNLVIGKLALRHLNQSQLEKTARNLGFESDIPFEFQVQRSPAHIPSEPIERAKVAAGFWNVDMSPLHGALLASIFARDGVYQPPHIIDQVIGPDGRELTPARPKPRRALDKRVARAVGSMMAATTRRGTARKSFRDKNGHDYIRDVVVAGKTGSLTGKRPPALNYNWFVGYAPADHPEIAFAVLLANEPSWRIKAHYAGRRLVQIYLDRREAISQGRDMRLKPQAVVLPERVAGVLLNAEPTAGPDKAPSTPQPSAPQPTPTALPQPNVSRTAPPPVPGPTAQTP